MLFASSLRPCSFSLSDGWLFVIVSTDRYTVWTSGNPSELMASGSAAIEPWDQYIRWKMLRERNYASALCLEVCKCLPQHPFDFVSCATCRWVFPYPCQCANMLVDVHSRSWLCWHGQIRKDLDFRHNVPCQRLPGRDSKSLPLIFLPSLLPSFSFSPSPAVCPKCFVAARRIN